MRNPSILVPCKKCEAKVNYADLRRNKDGLFVCSSCLSHTYSKSDAEIPNLIQSKIKKEEFKETKNLVKDTKVVYYCSNCKFSFTRPWNSSELKGCPYCNQLHSIQKKQTANDLLKNIDAYIE